MYGKLVVNTGSMFSGKTTELLRQGKRHVLAKESVLYIKPLTDTRYSDTKIVSHTGDYTESLILPPDVKLLDIPEIVLAEVILVDEVQFFEEHVAYQLNELANVKPVYVSGLDMTFRGEPFKTTMLLMGLADVVNKFKAVCTVCGEDAYVSALRSFKVDGGILELGSDDKYMPLCRDCYEDHIIKVLSLREAVNE